MSKVWLSLGANMDDPSVQLTNAMANLRAHPEIEVTSISTMAKYRAWGKTDQPDFHNLAMEINTTLTPIDLLDFIQSIENEMGRVRAEKWGPRLIDIDIIAYERIEMDTKRLTLPHPHAHEREFVLEPLREISQETVNWLETLSAHK